MKAALLFASVAAAMATTGCKTNQQFSALRDDALADDAAVIEAVRAALKEGGCVGCHSDVNDASLKQWALNTRSSAERLATQETEAGFDPAAFGPKGVYRAYPEYFKQFYKDDTQYQAFADDLRPDPDMKVKGSGDKQKQRFEAIRDSMLKLAEDSGSTNNQCVTQISAPLREHIKDMATTGWAAKLLTGDNGGQSTFQSFGCPVDTVDPLKCLSDTTKFKPRPEFIAGELSVPSARIVELANVGSTYFWTRSSADGRYVGNGSTGNDAHIDDIQDNVRYVIAKKSYDPGFFPDNSGFTIHGSPATFCSMSVLRTDDSRNQAGTMIVGGKQWKQFIIDPKAAHNQAQCLSDDGSATGVGGGDSRIQVYQSVGSGQGTRAYVLTGAHENDPGDIRESVGLDFTGDLQVYELKRNAAGGYDRVSNEPIEFTLPGEGDYSLTPSTQYISGRITGKDAAGVNQQLGYRLRSLTNMMAKGSSYNPAEDPTVSSICFAGSGSKPLASYDERFLTFHQYNPERFSSDVYLIDLLQEGRTYRLTDIPKGKQALFAHFRADGWLYFLVVGDSGANVMASDAAIRIAEGTSLGVEDDLESIPVPRRPTPAGQAPAGATRPRSRP